MDKKAQWSLVAAAWFAALSVSLFSYLNWQRGAAAALAVVPGSPSLAPRANGTVRCPVTGELLLLRPDTPTVNYRGQVYYFSTTKDANGLDARTRFLMDPDRYLSPTAQP